MIWQPKNNPAKECINDGCIITTHEPDGICAVCKVMAEVAVKCNRIDKEGGV